MYPIEEFPGSPANTSLRLHLSRGKQNKQAAQVTQLHLSTQPNKPCPTKVKDPGPVHQAATTGRIQAHTEHQATKVKS